MNGDGVANLGANQDIQAYNLFAYGSNNPVMNIDPYGMFNWGNFAIAVVGVLVVATLSAATAGVVAAAIGASVATAQALAFTGTYVAGALTIMEQIVEEGEVTDPEEIITDTADEAPIVILDSVCAGMGSSAKTGRYAINSMCQIGKETTEDVKNGQPFWDTLRYNVDEYLFANYVEHYYFPHALDILNLVVESIE